MARLRRESGIKSRRRRRFVVTTRSKYTKQLAPNLLNQTFKAERVNQVWVGDVTFIGTRQGVMYLSVLLDLYSRKVIGWSMSNRNNTNLVIKALEMALARRRPAEKVLHHTDQGCVYGAEVYLEKMKKHAMVASMSRKGNCYDNAVAESFFSTIKNELLWDHRMESTDQVRKEIFEFIEVFYNRQRIHQTLGYQTPSQFEESAVSSLNCPSNPG